MPSLGGGPAPGQSAPGQAAPALWVGERNREPVTSLSHPMVHDIFQRDGMGSGSGFARTALVWTLLAAFLSPAGAEPRADSRLLFDPAGLDQSAAGSDRNGAAQNNGSQYQAPPAAQAWAPPVFALPDFGQLRTEDAVPVPALRKDDSSAAANLLDPRVSIGKLSIGVETETQLKPRSLSGDDVASERDATLDPHRRGGLLPFIGFSAKSSLQ